jgi:hypothetical protein
VSWADAFVSRAAVTPSLLPNRQRLDATVGAERTAVCSSAAACCRLDLGMLIGRVAGQGDRRAW